MKTEEAVKTLPQLEAIIQKSGPLFDVIIIGGGPAGLTSAIYTGRSRLKTLIIEKALVGGAVSQTYNIENYPGFPNGVGGIDLSQKFEEHVRKLGIQIYYGEVSKISANRIVEIEGRKLHTKTIIISTGTEMKKLGVKGEAELTGRGVSYCATCDGPFYRGKNIAVVGGGNTAVEEALYLTRFASKVSIIHRRDKLRAEKILVEHAMNDPKVFIIWNSVVESIEGGKKTESIVLRNVQTNIKTKLPMDGVFVYIGMKPNTNFALGTLKMTEDGYIEVDRNMKTSAPGIFAAGDVLNKSLRQIVTATGEGAVAADSARRFIEEND